MFLVHLSARPAFCLIPLAALLGCGDALAPLDEAASVYSVYEATGASNRPGSVVTLADAQKILAGMEQEKTLELIGNPPTNIEDIAAPTAESFLRYRWENGDGSWLMVTFVDRKVRDIKHEGLK